jgi:hypothetical protein
VPLWRQAPRTSAKPFATRRVRVTADGSRDPARATGKLRAGRVLSNTAQGSAHASEGICMDRDFDQGRQVYSVLRDLLTGVVLLILTVQAEIRLPGDGAVTGVGAWLSATSAYFAYRAALYLRRAEAYPRDPAARSALRKRWRSLSRAQRKAPQERTAS